MLGDGPGLVVAVITMTTDGIGCHSCPIAFGVVSSVESLQQA
jgi:hypothetical protein